MITSEEGKKSNTESQKPILAIEVEEPFPLSMRQCIKDNSC